MKIFGRGDIGCGQCIPAIETPVGDACAYCSVPIKAGDIGVVMPHVAEVVIDKPWHIACLRTALGIERN